MSSLSLFMSLVPLHAGNAVVFQTVGTPGTVKLVTILLCCAEAIRVSLGTLNAPDQLYHIQEILF